MVRPEVAEAAGRIPAPLDAAGRAAAQDGTLADAAGAGRRQRRLGVLQLPSRVQDAAGGRQPQTEQQQQQQARRAPAPPPQLAPRHPAQGRSDRLTDPHL